MTEPLPEPVFEEVINKHSGKTFESKIMKEFILLTPKDKYIPYKKPDRREDKKLKARKDKSQEPEPKVECIPVEEDFNAENFSPEDTRWVIPAENTLKLLVKFYSKTQGNFESNLTFENTFNLKKLIVPIKGKT